MSGAVSAIARASVRSGMNHAARVLPRAAVAPVLLALAGVAVAVGIGTYSGLAGLLGPIAHSEAIDPATRERLLGTLVLSLVLGAFTVAIVFLAFLPQRSRIGLAARITGAGPWQVAMGEAVPVVIALVALAATVTAGGFWYVATQRADRVLVMAALVSLAVGAALAAVLVRTVVEVVATRLRMPDGLAHALGLLAAVAAAAAALIDTLAASVRGVEPVGLAVLRTLWRGRLLPSGPLDLVATIAVAAVLAAALLGALRLAAARSAFAAPWRILPVPRLGRPGGIEAQAAREMVLALRHPVSLLAGGISFALALLLGAAVRAGLLPGEVAALAIALLFAAGAETAYGRTRPWAWLLQSAGVGPVRRALVQQAVLLVGQGVPVVVLVALIAPTEAILPTLAGSAAPFVAMFAVAYAVGVIVPYTDAAPAGMTFTSALVIAAEALVLWAASSTSSLPGGLGTVVTLGIAAIAVGAGALVVHRRPVL